MKLYEINEAIETFFHTLDDETTKEEARQLWKELHIERGEKLQNTVLMYKNLCAESEAIRAEEIKLAERRKSVERQAENLKGYLSWNVKQGEKLKGANYSISWRKSESVEIDEALIPDMLPQEFKVVKITPNKTALKKSLKAGNNIKHVMLVEKQNIQIK